MAGPGEADRAGVGQGRDEVLGDGRVNDRNTGAAEIVRIVRAGD